MSRSLQVSLRRAALLASLLLTMSACGTPEEEHPAASVSGTAPQPAAAVAAKEADKEKADYVAKVALSNITVRKIVDPHDRLMGLVSGVVKNTGDRPLSDVEVTIDFLDRGNETTLETTYHPLSAGTRDEGPLKANSSRKWSAAIMVFEDWAGKANVRVTRVQFSEQ
jgi:hypothetical protein